MKKLLLHCLALLIVPIYGMSADIPIPDLFSEQAFLYPQEKLYVQTDKPYYIVGEDVWFRAFLADNMSLIPDTTSRYVYGELVSPVDTVVTRVKVRPVNGAYSGYIHLDESLVEGDYQLRFYTQYMQNTGEEYFFRKRIAIGGGLSGYYRTDAKFKFPETGKVDVTLQFFPIVENTGTPIVPSKVLIGDRKGKKDEITLVDSRVHLLLDPEQDVMNRILYLEYYYDSRVHRQYIPIPMPDTEYNVSFFPEGGNLPSGTLARIAFKALDPNGLGEKVTGYITDGKGERIADIESNGLGMGAFSIKADAGETYTAVCRNGKGYEKSFTLPEAKPDAISIGAGWHNGNLNVTVLASQNTQLPEDMDLLIHCRGKLLYNDTWNNSKNYIRLDGKQLPSGILHIVLSGKDRNILSERLVFNVNEEADIASLTFTPNQNNYVRRDKVKAEVNLTGADGTPLEGSFAISVTDDSDVTPDSTNNILTSMLLTSDLKGYIENPAYYFGNNNCNNGNNTSNNSNTGNIDKSRLADLDVLMLTQGWRRYDIPALLKGNVEKPKIDFEYTQAITGSVLGGTWLNKKKEGIGMLVVAMDTTFSATAVTDTAGRFRFDGFEWPDSTRYIVQALGKNGKRNVELTLDTVYYPAVLKPLPFSFPKDRTEQAKYMAKAEEKFTVEDGMRTYNIEEIVVQGKRREYKYESIYSSRVMSDVVWAEDHPTITQPIFLFSQLPRIMVYGDGLSLRAYFRNAEVKIMLDNILLDRDMNFVAYQMPIDMIETVELVYGGHLALLGTQAGSSHGLLIITTKKDYQNKIRTYYNVKNIRPLGYQGPKEFYSPVYETKEQRDNETPDLRTTVYWNPNIQTSPDGKAEVLFYTADAPTAYSVIIEGQTKDGRLIRNTSKIQRQ